MSTNNSGIEVDTEGKQRTKNSGSSSWPWEDWLQLTPRVREEIPNSTYQNRKVKAGRDEMWKMTGMYAALGWGMYNWLKFKDVELRARLWERPELVRLWFAGPKFPRSGCPSWLVALNHSLSGAETGLRFSLSSP